MFSETQRIEQLSLLRTGLLALATLVHEACECDGNSPRCDTCLYKDNINWCREVSSFNNNLQETLWAMKLTFYRFDVKNVRYKQILEMLFGDVESMIQVDELDRGPIR